MFGVGFRGKRSGGMCEEGAERMTKEQAVLELRQALSKVDRDLRLFGATEGQQAADRTWGALEHDMAVLQTTWKQIRAEQAPSEVKIIGPYPSAEQVHK